MTPDEALDLLDRCYHSPAVSVVRAEVERLRATIAEMEAGYGRAARMIVGLKADLAAARALLVEARESWIKVGYGASHEDVAECSDFCRRIDDALAGEGKP